MLCCCNKSCTLGFVGHGKRRDQVVDSFIILEFSIFVHTFFLDRTEFKSTTLEAFFFLIETGLGISGKTIHTLFKSRVKGRHWFVVVSLL